MQKWLPEAFPEDAAVVGQGKQAPAFTPEAAAVAQEEADNWTAALFRGEADFSDTDALLAHLTEKERGLICERIHGEIAADLAAEEARLAEEFAAKLAAQKREQTEALAEWGRNFRAGLDGFLAESAAAAARLSVQLAERIVRRQVDLDQGILARAVETTLFKIVDGSGITVTVNPADAAILRENIQLRQDLMIEEIKEDRRIQRGGCLVRTGELEWDATIGSQLETLGQAIEEAIAVGGSAAPAAQTADGDPRKDRDDEPGLE